MKNKFFYLLICIIILCGITIIFSCFSGDELPGAIQTGTSTGIGTGTETGTTTGTVTGTVTGISTGTATGTETGTVTGTTTGTSTGIASVLAIKILSPSASASFALCDNIDMNGTYSLGEGQTLTYIEYQVGTNGWNTCNVVDASTWNVTIPQNELTNGSNNSIQVRIEDTSTGLANDDVIVSVASYSGAPTINITSTNTELFDSLYILTGTLNNYNPAYSIVEYQINGSNWNTITGITGNDFSVTNIPNIIDDVHTVVTRISDCENQDTDTITVEYPINWITIPSGTFSMGNRWGGGDADELPVHTVQLSSFYMTETELTIAQYCKFLNNVEQSDNGRYNGSMASSTYCGITRTGSDGSYTYSVTSGRENHPIVYVTWTNSYDFCQWINGTLPTEAQWEYATGGPNHYRWSLSDTFVCTDYCSSVTPCGSILSSCEIKNYGTANGYGLWDMSGNIFEWVYDWYSDSSNGSTGTSSSSNSFYQNCYDLGTVTDPVNMYSSSSNRICRGGASYTAWNSLRSSDRLSYNPTSTLPNFGFRCTR